jgi:hypothetical protein
MKRPHSDYFSIIENVQRAEFGDGEESTHALLHDMPLRDQPPVQRRRATNNRATAAADAEPPAPTVYLDRHYEALRDEYMTSLLQQAEQSSVESDADDESVDEAFGDGGSDDDDDVYRKARRRPSRRSLSVEQRQSFSSNGGDGDDEEAEEEQRRYSPPPQQQQQQQPQQGGRAKCFLCESGNKYHSGVEIQHVEALHDMLNNGYGLCNKFELARRLHRYQRDFIYGKYGCRLLLTVEMAYAHIIGQHTLSAMIFVGESIDTWKEILFCTKNAIYRSDGSYNRGALADAEKAQKILNQLYQVDVGKLNFNCGKNLDDMKRLGAMHHVSTLAEQTRQQRARRKQHRQTLALENGSHNEFLL